MAHGLSITGSLGFRAAAITLVIGQLLAACGGGETVDGQLELQSSPPVEAEEESEVLHRFDWVDEELIRRFRESRPLVPPLSARFRRSAPSSE
jgi:hypothetical protein